MIQQTLKLDNKICLQRIFEFTFASGYQICYRCECRYKIHQTTECDSCSTCQMAENMFDFQYGQQYPCKCPVNPTFILVHTALFTNNNDGLFKDSTYYVNTHSITATYNDFIDNMWVYLNESNPAMTTTTITKKSELHYPIEPPYNKMYVTNYNNNDAYKYLLYFMTLVNKKN